MAARAALARQGDRTVRKALATKRRRRLVRRLVGLLRLVMAAIIAFGLYTLWTSPAWHWVGQMRITGNRLVSREEILRRLQVPHNTPLYRLDPRWIEGQLLGMPAIAHVAVRRWLFPARLELAIIERQPLVGVDGPTPGLWIDQEGVIFSAPGMKARFPVRLMTGLAVGDRLPEAVRAPLFDLLTLWPKGQAGRIDMRDPHDVSLFVDGWPVRLGEIQDVSTKLGMFEHLKPLAGKYKNRLEYIDLRFPASPTFKLASGEAIDAHGAKAKALPSPAPAAAGSGGGDPSPGAGSAGVPRSAPTARQSKKATPAP